MSRRCSRFCGASGLQRARRAGPLKGGRRGRATTSSPIHARRWGGAGGAAAGDEATAVVAASVAQAPTAGRRATDVRGCARGQFIDESAANVSMRDALGGWENPAHVGGRPLRCCDRCALPEWRVCVVR